VHAPEFKGRDGVALWSVWSAKDAAREPESGHLAGQIVYTPLIGKLKQHRHLEESGQGTASCRRSSGATKTAASTTSRANG
jgi:hypothetical protein